MAFSKSAKQIGLANFLAKSRKPLAAALQRDLGLAPLP
jgi:hypothetical protein